MNNNLFDISHLLGKDLLGRVFREDIEQSKQAFPSNNDTETQWFAYPGTDKKTDGVKSNQEKLHTNNIKRGTFGRDALQAISRMAVRDAGSSSNGPTRKEHEAQKQQEIEKEALLKRTREEEDQERREKREAREEEMQKKEEVESAQEKLKQEQERVASEEKERRLADQENEDRERKRRQDTSETNWTAETTSKEKEVPKPTTPTFVQPTRPTVTQAPKTAKSEKPITPVQSVADREMGKFVDRALTDADNRYSNNNTVESHKESKETTTSPQKTKQTKPVLEDKPTIPVSTSSKEEIQQSTIVDQKTNNVETTPQKSTDTIADLQSGDRSSASTIREVGPQPVSAREAQKSEPAQTAQTKNEYGDKKDAALEKLDLRYSVNTAGEQSPNQIGSQSLPVRTQDSQQIVTEPGNKVQESLKETTTSALNKLDSQFGTTSSIDSLRENNRTPAEIGAAAAAAFVASPSEYRQDSPSDPNTVSELPSRQTSAVEDLATASGSHALDSYNQQLDGTFTPRNQPSSESPGENGAHADPRRTEVLDNQALDVSAHDTLSRVNAWEQDIAADNILSDTQTSSDNLDQGALQFPGESNNQQPGGIDNTLLSPQNSGNRNTSQDRLREIFNGAASRNVSTPRKTGFFSNRAADISSSLKTGVARGVKSGPGKLLRGSREILMDEPNDEGGGGGSRGGNFGSSAARRMSGGAAAAGMAVSGGAGTYFAPPMNYSSRNTPMDQSDDTGEQYSEEPSQPQQTMSDQPTEQGTNENNEGNNRRDKSGKNPLERAKDAKKNLKRAGKAVKKGAKFAKKGIKYIGKGIKGIAKFLKSIPPQVWLIIALIIIVILIIIYIVASIDAANKSLEDQNTSGRTAAFFEYFGLAGGQGDTLFSDSKDSTVIFDSLNNVKQISIKYGLKLKPQDQYNQAFAGRNALLKVKDMKVCTEIDFPDSLKISSETIAYSNISVELAKQLPTILPQVNAAPITYNFDNNGRKVCWRPITCEVPIFSCVEGFADDLILRMYFDNIPTSDFPQTIRVKFGGTLDLAYEDEDGVYKYATLEIIPKSEKCFNVETVNATGLTECLNRVVEGPGGPGGPGNPSTPVNGFMCPFDMKSGDGLRCTNGFKTQPVVIGGETYPVHQAIDWNVTDGNGVGANKQINNSIRVPVKAKVLDFETDDSASLCGWWITVQDLATNDVYYFGHLQKNPGINFSRPDSGGNFQTLDQGAVLGTYFNRATPAYKNGSLCWDGAHVHMEMTKGGSKVSPYNDVKAACTASGAPLVNLQPDYCK